MQRSSIGPLLGSVQSAPVPLQGTSPTRFAASAAFLAILVTLAGCSTLHASGMRTGKVYPARPADCSVRFENLSFQEANAKYEQLGLVSLSGVSDEPSTWDGPTRERLQPRACELGATIVTPNASGGQGSVMGMGTGMVQFAAWREKTTARSSAP